MMGGNAAGAVTCLDFACSANIRSDIKPTTHWCLQQSSAETIFGVEAGLPGAADRLSGRQESQRFTIEGAVEHAMGARPG